MLGIKSINVWVMAIAVMKTTKAMAGIADMEENAGIADKRIAETRFMWIPGARPVKVPIVIPRRSAKRHSVSMIK